jgi:transcriptional regulator with XRE-family HTH domain
MMLPMTTRTRPADQAVADARRLLETAVREVELARIDQHMSQAAAARRAGMSPSAWGRLARRERKEPSVEQICRAARAVGLKPSLTMYPTGDRVRDQPQTGVLDRVEGVLRSPLKMRREVGVGIPGDLRSWDGRITGGGDTASLDAESKLHDLQSVARRVALKQRDDPDAGVVILVLNDTAHNRAVLREHREALRAQFPLDGAAVLRFLRSGRVPPLGGVLLI